MENNLKIFTSYFYQLRNFKPNQIPLSTAMYDPKWYTCGGGVYKNKFGVVCGFRMGNLVPNSSLAGLCHGVAHCKEESHECAFLRGYYEQLNRINFDHFISYLHRFASKAADCYKIISPELVLMVYETPDNPCSERTIIHEWFKEHNYPIEELSV